MSTSILTDVAPPPKSKTAQLEDLLPAIEAALAAGHPHTAIFDHIQNKIGLALSYRYYQLTLHRLRKRRDQASAKQTAKASSKAVASNLPLSVPAQPPESLTPAVFSSDTKDGNSSGISTKKEPAQRDNISAEQTRPRPFRWKGQEFLEKDWSNF